MNIRFSNGQRVVLWIAALAIIAFQLVGLANDGFSDHRGWYWAFLIAAALIVLALPSSGAQRTPARSTSTVGPSSPSSIAPAMEHFQKLMAVSASVVTACERLASNFHQYVLANRLYHESAPLAFVLDPRIHSSLTIHGLLVLALDKQRLAIDPLIWSTYVTTSAHRLALKRQAFSSSELPPSPSNAQVDKIFADMVKSEMKIYEDIAKKCIAENDNYEGYVRHVTATFGGRKDVSDDERMRPVVRSFLEEVSSSVVPLFQARA